MKKEILNGSTWSNRKRRDLPLITPPMMKVLLDLRAAAEADSPFIHLPGVHGNTLNSLLARDWIFASPGSDGTRYKITGRGLKALKVYEPTLRRSDGICPDCGKNPKHVAASGRVDGYCIDCLRKTQRRKYHLNIGKNPDTLCPRCKKRPRHRQPSGSVITWCKECDRERKRDAKREKRRQQLELVHAGEFIKCRKAECVKCAHFTDKTVYDMCLDHLRAYMNEYNDRRRPGSAASKTRRTKAARS